MAMRAVVAFRFTLPAIDALTMGAEIPIFLTVGVALTTQPPGFVKTNLAIPFCSQQIAVFIIVAGQAPKAVLAMI